jgi:DNA topoisomerase-1
MIVSAAKISKADDRELDKSASRARPGPPGVSIRNGPVEEDGAANGVGKRKSRASNASAVNYKDDSESDDGAPLVRFTVSPKFTVLESKLT